MAAEDASSTAAGCEPVTEDTPAQPDRLSELGEFIRQQRNGARLSLRHLSELAGISNPYLSQIERGLRRPSAEILQQIARALQISAETLYVRAGILEERAVSGGGTAREGLVGAILSDATLGMEQRQVLLRVYLSLRRENGSAPSLVPIEPGTASS
jgi:transcriptional regulator with XRE-family HTH domain